MKSQNICAVRIFFFFKKVLFFPPRGATKREKVVCNTVFVSPLTFRELLAIIQTDSSTERGHGKKFNLLARGKGKGRLYYDSSIRGYFDKIEDT